MRVMRVGCVSTNHPLTHLACTCKRTCTCTCTCACACTLARAPTTSCMSNCPSPLASRNLKEATAIACFRPCPWCTYVWMWMWMWMRMCIRMQSAPHQSHPPSPTHPPSPPHSVPPTPSHPPHPSPPPHLGRKFFLRRDELEPFLSEHLDYGGAYTCMVGT